MKFASKFTTLAFLLTIFSLSALAQSRPDQVNVVQTDASAFNNVSATSTVNNGFLPQNAVNGDTSGINWGSPIYPAGGGWNSSTPGATDTLTVPFARAYLLKEIVIFGLKNDFGSPREPVEGETSLYANKNFVVQSTADGTNWSTVAGGVVSGNSLVINHFLFSEPVFSKGVRVTITNPGDYARVVEVQVWAKNNR